MNTNEKDMTLSQELGMVTVKNAILVFLENGVDFHVLTVEGEGVISKGVQLNTYFNIIDSCGELYMDAVNKIVFRLPEREEEKIWFYNIHDEILELDCFKGFDIIAATFTR